MISNKNLPLDASSISRKQYMIPFGEVAAGDYSSDRSGVIESTGFYRLLVAYAVYDETSALLKDEISDH